MRRTFAPRAPHALLAIACSLVTGLAVACSGDSPTEAQAECESPAVSAGYTGSLYDTHLHVEQQGVGDRVRCRMDEYGVATAVAFVHMDPSDPAGTERRLRDELGGAPRFVPFFQVDPKAPADLAAQRLTSVLAGRESLFAGVGEMGLYRDPWRSTKLSDSPWPGVFGLAAERGLWLMIHPRIDQAADVRAVLEAYPNVKVMMHGPELRPHWAELLRSYPNLHLSVDAAALLVPSGAPPSGLFFGSAGSAAFIAAYDSQRDALLENALSQWAPVIAAAPDRVMWGSDAALDWHLDPQVYARMIDISRRFVSRLPAAHQAPYASQNAARLFGAGRAL